MGRRVKAVVTKTKQAGDPTLNVESGAKGHSQSPVPRSLPKVFRYREQNQKVNSQKGAFFLHVVFIPDI